MQKSDLEGSGVRQGAIEDKADSPLEEGQGPRWTLDVADLLPYRLSQAPSLLHAVSEHPQMASVPYCGRGAAEWRVVWCGVWD